jgi:hypothetical protein
MFVLEQVVKVTPIWEFVLKRGIDLYPFAEFDLAGLVLIRDHYFE